MPEAPEFHDRMLSLGLGRVSEAAALASARLIGRGDEKAADQAAVDSLTGGQSSSSSAPDLAAPDVPTGGLAPSPAHSAKATDPARHRPLSRGHAGYSLRSRAATVSAILAMAVGTAGMLEQQRHEAERLPVDLLRRAVELADVSDLDFDPADLDESDQPPVSPPDTPPDPPLSPDPMHGEESCMRSHHLSQARRHHHRDRRLDRLSLRSAWCIPHR